MAISRPQRFAAVVLSLILVLALASLAWADEDGDHGKKNKEGKPKSSLCHATGSATNPFVLIAGGKNAAKGHKRHDGDIIPAPADGCPAVPPVTPPATPPATPDEPETPVTPITIIVPVTVVLPTTPTTTTPVTTTPLPTATSPAPRACSSRRKFKIRVRLFRGIKWVKASVFVNGKKVQTLTGKRLQAPVDLTGLPKGTVNVKIIARAANGLKVTSTRTYRTCVPKSKIKTTPTL